VIDLDNNGKIRLSRKAAMREQASAAPEPGTP